MSQAATRQQVRIELAQRLPTIEELDAFCLDCFPEVKTRFSAGMDRLARETMLLEMQEPAEVQDALRSYSRPQFPQRLKPARWVLVALVPILGAVAWIVAGMQSHPNAASSAIPPFKVTPSAKDASLKDVKFDDPMEFAARAQRLQKAARIEAKATVSADGREKEVTVILVDEKTSKPISFTHYASPISAAWSSGISPDVRQLFASIDEQVQERAEAFLAADVPEASVAAKPEELDDAGTNDLPDSGQAPAASEGDTAENLLQVGIDAFNRNDFSSAQKALIKALGLLDKSKTSEQLTYNVAYYLGRIFEAQGEYARALTEYQRLIKSGSGNSAQQRFVAEAVPRLVPRVGRVRVSSPNSTGACVATEFWLDAGTHRLEIFAGRYVNVSVRAQQTYEINICP